MMKKKLCSALLALCMSITLFSGTALAEGTPSVSNNGGKHDYINFKRWSSTVSSSLFQNEQGGLTRVENIGNKIIIENYGDGFAILSHQEMDMELPIWGGFFSGSDYNFLVFGQENWEQNDEQEVIRVVKYSKNWERLGAASLYGANTVVPFDGGSLRMVQDGDKLYLHTAHLMYAALYTGGLNHQSNLTFSVKISDMTIADECIWVSIGTGYVSHSFNQFILLDDSTLLTADHGDAYPRSLVLTRYKTKEFTARDTSYCEYATILPIKGESGNNDTGAMLGGLTASSTSYLTVGCSIPQDEASTSQAYNIFVSTIPKDPAAPGGVKWITNFSDADAAEVSNPHIVKLGSDQFLLLYMVNGVINYVYLDGNGNATSSILTMTGSLSDCVPISYNGLVVWYYTQNSTPVFCVIDGNGNGFSF